MAPEFKSFPNILTDMVAKFLSNTGINDINPGSNIITFLEASAQEHAAAYYQMSQLLRLFNLDTTEGQDLDDRGKDFDLERLAPQKANSIVDFSDISFTQKKTKVYSGSSGPVVGQTFVNVDNAAIFPSTGFIIVGRGTDKVEKLSYVSITNFNNFFRINLAGAFSNDHGTEESVILAQAGDRIIPKGTVVRVPSSDVLAEIQFITTEEATILDGDTVIKSIPIISILPGKDNNVPAGAVVEFDSKPFATAAVTNPRGIVDGDDLESDDKFRQRIKDKIQSLSKGTKSSVLSALIGLTSADDNKRIVSDNLVDSIDLEDIPFLYVDDGTGLEPSSKGSGNEVLIEATTGGEEYLQLDFFPVIKAEVETENSQPFEIVNGDTLLVEVNGKEESMIFSPADYIIEGALTAYEVTRAINSKMSSIEARTADAGTKVVIRAVDKTNESIQVINGTANDKLGFSTKLAETINLYKFNGSTLKLLSKDGETAFIKSDNIAPYAIFGSNTLTIIVDGKSANTQTITFVTDDMENPGFATAQEVVTRINQELSGAVASIDDEGLRVLITSNTKNSANSKIQVTGGVANAALGFDTGEVTGFDKDFTLNRFNGQVKLTNIALAGETYETGSALTRGFLISQFAEEYLLTDGDTITISVDGGGDQVVTFLNADFGLITAATAQEVVDIINRDTSGLNASVTSDDRISIRTNTWDKDIGSIEVVAVSGTATALGFSVGEVVSNIDGHVGSVVSGNANPYDFEIGDTLDIVVDKDPVDNQFEIVMDLDGVVTIGDNVGPYNTFIANISSIGQNFNLKFTGVDELKDFKIIWLTGDNAAAESLVSAYNNATGQFTLAVGLGNSIDPGDSFTIIPIAAISVVKYLSNNAVSSLGSVADVELVGAGNKVQISSRTPGTAGSIQVTGGSANVELGFSTSQVIGRDGYKYYTGILQKAQHTIDGLDADLENYPGVKAAGVQIEVLPPIVKLLKFEIDLSLKDGITALSIKDKVIDAVSSYVNTLGVGKDVILTEIIDLLMDIEGVTDVEFITPSSNEAIADNEIARVSTNDIIFA